MDYHTLVDNVRIRHNIPHFKMDELDKRDDELDNLIGLNSHLWNSDLEDEELVKEIRERAKVLRKQTLFRLAKHHIANALYAPLYLAYVIAGCMHLLHNSMVERYFKYQILTERLRFANEY